MKLVKNSLIFLYIFFKGMSDVMHQQNADSSHHGEIPTLQTTINNNTTAMQSKWHVGTWYYEDYLLHTKCVCI